MKSTKYDISKCCPICVQMCYWENANKFTFSMLKSKRRTINLYHRECVEKEQNGWAKDNNKGKIDFKEHPTGFPLMAAYLILKGTVDFHFTGPEQAKLALEVYEKIENVEEVPYDV